MSTLELPITGYLDRFSHRPGESFAVYVSLRDGGSYRAHLVRVVCADPNPAGPGMRLDDLSGVFDRSVAGRHQPIRLGSYGIVPAGPVRDARSACTWSVLVWPGVLDQGRTVLAEQDGHAGVALGVSDSGACARLTWRGGTVELCTGVALSARRWYRVWLTADPAGGRVAVGQCALERGTPAHAAAQADGLVLPSGGPVLFAAENAEAPCRHFTGKLEDPAISAGWHNAWPDPPAGAVLAAWDFADGIGSQAVTDTGPQCRHGRLVNLPARGMVGARWTGREMCWRHAPRDYAAIHFHDDDLADCGWQADFTWNIPDDLPSGAYALHLTCDAGEDFLPFYVLPRRSGPFAPIAFLAPTFTYQAYANHARGNTDAAHFARVAAWGAYPANPDQFPVYGRSTYNVHADRSGFCFSSRRRPLLTMRPGFITFNDPYGSGVRHYPGDTHLIAWLTAKGLAFDVITDEDLDDEGVELLAPYRMVLTGSHPEYHTLGTLDGLQAYTGRGGKLAYLGGDGFYWRVARSRELPEVIELRRAEGGVRAWAAEPGEYYHQLDGQYGGLWRRNRRPPQMLVGVGFSGQGRFEGTYYRRLPASYEQEFAWMFAGIDEEKIGDYGLSGGGAAGFELDRADPLLGTPENAAILARSENPPASFIPVFEEMLSDIATVTGEKPADLMRGEIVYFTTPSGGAVFSVGSITFCGSLWHNGFTGPVSRLLENVVRHFLEEP
jgi:N,N-dimethylformamidase